MATEKRGLCATTVSCNTCNEHIEVQLDINPSINSSGTSVIVGCLPKGWRLIALQDVGPKIVVCPKCSPAADRAIRETIKELAEGVPEK